MKIAVIAGGRTAEAEGTLGSAEQLARAAAELGHHTSLVSVDAAGHPQNRMSALLKAAEHDVAIPLIPGLEGTLEFLDVPYVGSSPVAAGIAAHKGLFNDLLVAAGLGKVRYVYGSGAEVLGIWQKADMSLPVFVKPARLGASYGISRVATSHELSDAINAAAEHDPVVLIEESVPTPFTEYEVPIIAGRDIVSAPPGQVCLPEATEWHDTLSKYSLDAETSRTISRTGDAELDSRLMEAALAAASLAGVACAARVDLFVDAHGQVYVGEINALPGQGFNSNFPRIFELAGFSRPRQLELMIDSALFHRQLKRAGAYAF
ncbi:D-alanine--D-alanine ligase family protein [Streptomyces parvus]|uniref:D-alanine--D-alanine ligase family protein n=1 Tax=Streptomyces parvus TaxID=66428 RepID=UPI003D75E0F7